MGIIFGFCFKCDNKGYQTEVTDEMIPRSEWTAQEFALHYVEGGLWYRTKKVPCPDLSKPKHKRPPKHL